MAFTALVPASINANIRRGAAQAFKSSAVVDFSGAAINLSAYDSLTAKLVALSANPNTADVTFGTVTGDASGILTLTLDASDLASNPTGTSQLVIIGKPVAGDDFQLLASGSAQLSDG